MNRILIILAAGVAGFILPACDKDKAAGKASAGGGDGGANVGEKAALDAFKADVKAIKDWTEKNQPDNPAAGMAMVAEMATKLKAVRTQGLPADLNAAFQKMLAVMDKVQAALKEMPTDATPPDASFQAKMEAIDKEGDAAAEELKTVGKKYGLDDLELGK